MLGKPTAEAKKEAFEKHENKSESENPKAKTKTERSQLHIISLLIFPLVEIEDTSFVSAVKGGDSGRRNGDSGLESLVMPII